MKNRIGIAPGAVIPALILLALGMFINLGFTRARGEEVRRLSAQRDALRAQAVGVEGREERTRELAQRLGGTDLAAALEGQQGIEPVDYINRTLAEVGLRSLELGTQGTTQTERLRRTRYFVRAEGSFAALQRFFRQAELSPRVLIIDGFTVERPVGVNSLDVRINLSIYEPLTRRGA